MNTVFDLFGDNIIYLIAAVLILNIIFFVLDRQKFKSPVKYMIKVLLILFTVCSAYLIFIFINALFVHVL